MNPLVSMMMFVSVLVPQKGWYAPNQPIDIARNGLNLQFGSRANGMVITLAEGAASVRGRSCTLSTT